MIKSGRKTFEHRVNDRNYKPGDTLLLREWDPETETYTGNDERRVVADIIDLAPLSESVVLVFVDEVADKLRADNARLRAALQRIADPIACGCSPCTGICCSEASKALYFEGQQDFASEALAATPAQSLAAVKAAALREVRGMMLTHLHVADKVQDFGDGMRLVRDEADRLEREAK
jgi:ASC-1-like (ASCH) protein